MINLFPCVPRSEFFKNAFGGNMRESLVNKNGLKEITINLETAVERLPFLGLKNIHPF